MPGGLECRTFHHSDGRCVDPDARRTLAGAATPHTA
jgi:hypothetical protein